jgi:hypothetical protein
MSEPLSREEVVEFVRKHPNIEIGELLVGIVNKRLRNPRAFTLEAYNLACSLESKLRLLVVTLIDKQILSFDNPERRITLGRAVNER